MPFDDGELLVDEKPKRGEKLKRGLITIEEYHPLSIWMAGSATAVHTLAMLLIFVSMFVNLSQGGPSLLFTMGIIGLFTYLFFAYQAKARVTEKTYLVEVIGVFIVIVAHIFIAYLAIS